MSGPAYLIQQSATAGAVDSQDGLAERIRELSGWVYEFQFGGYGDLNVNVFVRYAEEESPRDHFFVSSTNEEGAWILKATRVLGRSLKEVGIAPYPQAPGLKVVSASADEMILSAAENYSPSWLQIGVSGLNLFGESCAVAGVQSGTFQPVWFAEPLLPMIVRDQPFAIDALVVAGGGVAVLDMTLTRFFDLLCGAGSKWTLNLKCSFTYSLPDGVHVALPVLLAPRLTRDQIFALGAQIVDWWRRTAPPRGGSFGFDATVYAPDSTERPVLRLTQLTLSAGFLEYARAG